MVDISKAVTAPYFLLSRSIMENAIDNFIEQHKTNTGIYPEYICLGEQLLKRLKAKVKNKNERPTISETGSVFLAKNCDVIICQCGADFHDKDE